MTISLPVPQVNELSQWVSQAEHNQLDIDLASQSIGLNDGRTIGFDIDPLRKQALLQGLDAIGSTLQRAEQIRQFERGHLQENPWLA